MDFIATAFPAARTCWLGSAASAAAASPTSLIGTWRLRATWSRDGTPAPAASAALLKGLGACLILSGEEAEGALRIANQVNLGSLRLRFDGEAELTGRRPLLMFSFRSVRLSLGKLTLFERACRSPTAAHAVFAVGLDAEQGRQAPGGAEEDWPSGCAERVRRSCDLPDPTRGCDERSTVPMTLSHRSDSCCWPTSGPAAIL